MMTEQQWLSCRELLEMVLFLNDRVSPRKRRLFACACCRFLWDKLPSECSQRGVEVGDRFADGMATSEEREHAQEAIQILKEEAVVAQEFERAAALCDTEYPVSRQLKGCRWYSDVLKGDHECDLLRDIIGNPFRSVTLDPSWLTWNRGTIPQLAQAIYDTRGL